VQSYADAYLDPSKAKHWRQDWDVSGLNVLDMGMMIEVMHRWLGYAKRVTAMTATFTPERSAGPYGGGKVDRPDSVYATAELENGALASFVLSGVARNAAEGNSFEIYGSDGTIRYLYAADKILAGRAGDTGLREVPISDQEARPWSVEADFVAAVRAGRRSGSPSFWDGLKYIELTEAIFRSAESGCAVELPLAPVAAPSA
jgi:predicted dehydrogenase